MASAEGLSQPINTDLLYSDEEHQRAKRFYERSGYSISGTPWEDAPRSIRGACLELASHALIRETMKLDQAVLPTPTGWRNFLGRVLGWLDGSPR